MAAIKARLRALRNASGGSIDLAGVRDRVLDSLYKQKLAAEERRGQRAAEAREQERLAAQMAARLIGERIRSESLERRHLRDSRGSSDKRRNMHAQCISGSDDSSDDAAVRNRRSVSRGRRASFFRTNHETKHRRSASGRAGSRDNLRHPRISHASTSNDSSDTEVPPYRRPGRCDDSSENSEAETASQSFHADESYDSNYDRHPDARKNNSSRSRSRSKRSNKAAEYPAAIFSRELKQSRNNHHGRISASGKSTSRDGSLFLSGPSTNFSHPRTPLFHNVGHVLHARR